MKGGRSEDAAGLWETVRRALGRLVTATDVQELPLMNVVTSPAVASAAVSAPPPPPGSEEMRWRPAAREVRFPMPRADAGAGGADLTPTATVLALPTTPGSGGVVVHASGLPLGLGPVHRLEGISADRLEIGIHGVPTVLTVGELRCPPVRVAAPATARLPVEAPGLPRESRLLRRVRRTSSADPLRLTGGDVRSGMAVNAELPLTRRRRPVPAGTAASDAFVPERGRLARSTSIPDEDMVLLGVFPQVPVAAVRRLALSDEGDLVFWLKPEALAAAAAGQSPRLVTLIVGRQRSTGKMIQTVA